jgi:hypothetical protein
MTLVIACVLMLILVPIEASKASVSLFDRPHAFLAQGQSGQYKWRLVTHRSENPEAKLRPCLDLSIALAPAPLASAPFFSLCGALVPFPVVAAFATDLGTKGKTLVGVAVPLNVRRVQMDLGSAGKRRRGTKLLSASKARAAQLEQFRFASVVVRGAHCVQRLEAFNANGRLVFDSGRHPCY